MSKEELYEKILDKVEKKGWSKKPFNIFNACGVEHRELTHSAFIANLLNPQGTHGCGNIFLQNFIDILKKKKNITTAFLDKLSDNVWVDTEHDLGNEHGRIDIWIKSKTQNAYLLIENKIDAGDEEKQLWRYREYLKIKSKKHEEPRKGLIFYLTKNGKAASDYSTRGELKRNEDDGYYTISYFKEIKEWLNLSIMNLADKENGDRVVSAIHQYIVLLDYINFKIELTKELIAQKFTKIDIKKALTKNNPHKSIHYKEIEDILEYFEYKLKQDEIQPQNKS